VYPEIAITRVNLFHAVYPEIAITRVNLFHAVYPEIAINDILESESRLFKNGSSKKKQSFQMLSMKLLDDLFSTVISRFK
jgi:hypothetical protein